MSRQPPYTLPVPAFPSVRSPEACVDHKRRFRSSRGFCFAHRVNSFLQTRLFSEDLAAPSPHATDWRITPEGRCRAGCGGIFSTDTLSRHVLDAWGRRKLSATGRWNRLKHRAAVELSKRRRRDYPSAAKKSMARVSLKFEGMDEALRCSRRTMRTAKQSACPSRR